MFTADHAVKAKMAAPCAGAASEPCMHGPQALMAILHAWATGSASTGIWSLHGACLHAVALLQGAHAFRLLPSRGPAGFPACIRRRLATCAAALRRRWPAASMMARCRTYVYDPPPCAGTAPASSAPAATAGASGSTARPGARSTFHACHACHACLCMHGSPAAPEEGASHSAPEEGASHSCMLRPRSP